MIFFFFGLKFITLFKIQTSRSARKILFVPFILEDIFLTVALEPAVKPRGVNIEWRLFHLFDVPELDSEVHT